MRVSRGAALLAAAARTSAAEAAGRPPTLLLLPRAAAARSGRSPPRGRSCCCAAMSSSSSGEPAAPLGSPAAAAAGGGARRRPLVVVIAGPTAVGKTALSLALAEALGGEIISADSVQVYCGLDVGSDKLPVGQRRGIRHHLIDVLPPTAEFSAGDFHDAARAATADILSRRVPWRAARPACLCWAAQLHAGPPPLVGRRLLACLLRRPPPLTCAP